MHSRKRQLNINPRRAKGLDDEVSLATKPTCCLSLDIQGTSATFCKLKVLIKETRDRSTSTVHLRLKSAVSDYIVSRHSCTMLLMREETV